MSITVTEIPPSIAAMNTATKQPPIPVSDCWRVCLQADAADAITTTGAKATLVVSFPSTLTVPSNGTVMKIWGYDFTVQSATDYTSISYKVVTSGVLTALNFANMIQANLFFNRAVSVAASTSGSNTIITVTWNECREQPRFSAPNMVFTGITATGATATATNGTSPVYADGYKIITRLGRFVDATSVFVPVSEFNGVDADKQCTAVGEVCLDFAADAQSQLYTELPALTSTSFISAIQNGRSLCRLFGVEYGDIKRVDCQSQSGTIKKSNIILGINAAFDIDDPYQMRRYWHDHPDGFPAGQSVPDFLTYQPKKYTLCRDSYSWLWLLNNFQQDHGTYKLFALFNCYGNGVSEQFTQIINDPGTDGHSWYQPVNFNASPKFVYPNLTTLTQDTLEFYEVQVFGAYPTAEDVLFNASEILHIDVEACCQDSTDIYFLTSPGGIGTLPVDIDSETVVQDGQEIQLYNDCGDDRATRATKGGRTLTNLRSYTRITFSKTCKNSAEWKRWLTDFRKSPQRWVKVIDGAGNPIAKKAILQPDDITVRQSGQAVELKGVLYLQDIPQQNIII